MATERKASRFDELFETGASIVNELDLKSAARPGLEIQRINVDFPAWEVQALDREANRLGITRQSLIKVWIAERIDAMQSNALHVASPRPPSWKA